MILINGLEMPKGDGVLSISIYSDGKVCMSYDISCTKVAEASEFYPAVTVAKGVNK